MEQRLEAKKPTMKPYEYDVLTYKPSEFKAAEAWARTKGYTEFNVRTIDLATPPDFTKTITTA